MRTIATVGGLGHSPITPGTLGSAVGLGISWLLGVHPLYQVGGCLIAAVLGFWSSGPTAKALGKEDPSCVIIDEVAGMMIALAALPLTWPVYLGAFLLFRFLDVVKPGPINAIQRLPGSWGIMLDDLLAGLAANLLIRLFIVLRS